jgi:hypothetical protein
MTDRDNSIAFILDCGLVKPKTAREYAVDIFRALGWKYIFRNTAYSLIFAALTVAVVSAMFALVSDSYRFSATIAAAPLLYLLIAVFTEMSERANGIYELKQTFYYTTRQITALRTLCYSAVGAVYTAALATAAMQTSAEFLPVFALGLLALFICAALQLLITRPARNGWANAVYAAIWIFANIALPIRFGAAWEHILTSVPIAVSLSVAIAAATVFVYVIRKMLMEVKPYALS